ncbi:ABC transporter ATP-binding protein [Paenibacillus antarcticus]|uniref:Multidrug ABC transporter ATP-binding protein n=1 Tax=Paenibacillus antarcticus TaxID=253703 RepID=A0A168MNV0_9BACL|nr:ATP-binding cassette domain-containing protein [Paenibacillus antarcticus]OAB44889.1 multidrug ABC transporter ATP-binding protein [Paenibacillus antarcticus]
MGNAIEVNHLVKSFEYYKKDIGMKQSLKNLFFRKKLVKEAVNDVSFTIAEGEMVGFLGQNGAGKTTTLKILSGILHPTAGNVSVFGYTPWERKKQFKQIFSIVMGQKSQLWPDLPAGESIFLNKCIYQVSDEDYRRTLDELSELLDVKDLLGVQVRRLSFGERMKMELIASLIHRPKLMFLDEPTIGLDIISQRAVRNFLKYYNEQYQATIILTSHYMKDIEDLCPRAILINAGSIIYDGELKKINAYHDERKLIKLHFAEPILSEPLRAFGELKEFDGYYAVIEVGKEEAQICLQQCLDRFPVMDFTIEDLTIEDGIVELYRGSA